MKKLLKILFVVIIIAVGIGIYWLFDKSQSNGEPFGGTDGLSIGDFFPFGTGNNPDTEPIIPNEPETPDQPNTQVPTRPPRLWKISSEPQAGAIAYYASNTPMARYIDRATGNVYEAALNLLGNKRISNTTIPQVYEAVWVPGGKSLVFRYLDSDYTDVQTSVGTLVLPKTSSTTDPATQGISELKATFLSDSIGSVAMHGNGALTFINIFADKSAVYTANNATGTARQIYSSPIKDFIVSAINNTDIGLLTKPTAVTPGYFYTLKRDSGAFARKLGGMNGLFALMNPAGDLIAFSESRSNSFSFGLQNIKTGIKSAVPFNTLADKCVWSKLTTYLYCATPKSIPGGQYPDDWYKGRVSFSDSIWRLDTATGATEFLGNTTNGTAEGIDAINLTLDPKEQYLLFTNKKDSQLWGLRLVTGS